ncbi:biofilm regulation protein phosphatase SiaA [Noviherbaspirillum agri]
MGRALGLRGKSVLALFGFSLLILLLAGLVGAQAISSIKSYLGGEFARNFTLLNRERIIAPVSREMALSMRLAGSHVVRQWLADEADPGKKALALRELEGFRTDFAGKAYFLVSGVSNHYYFSDAASTAIEPRYRLKADDPNDAWFFNLMKGGEPVSINVNPDVKLGLTKVWFNVVVEEGGRRIGVAGSGLDLSAYLRDFLGTGKPGVTPMIVDARGAIQVHPDSSRIAFNSANSAVGAGQSLFGLLQDEQHAAAVRAALAAAASQPGEAHVVDVTMDGKRQLLAAAYIPELKWHVLTAIDLDAAKVVDTGLLKTIGVAMLALLVLVVGAFAFAVNRLVLAPLHKLKLSAQAMAAGNYAVALPPARDDEIGELTDAFGAMARKVRQHTEELEATVRERTGELVRANQEMASAHKKISDSISYASLIQRALLPDRHLTATLGDRHFVLWRPRDVIGGDFYVYREVDGGCLLGVVDCAGHGVPGAFMTMLAHAAIDHAIDQAGATDPAAILERTDQAMRAMLQAQAHQHGIATLMDAGFAYIDFAARQVTFAGAKIALYWCDGNEVGIIKGGRRSLGDRQQGRYRNEHKALLPSHTFYLTTDGFLDQAGGDKGYGFGNTRFVDMLRQHANRPLSEQYNAFADTLATYQGSHPQRDDITIVSFRFA